MSKFGNNIDFLKYLNLADKDQNLKGKLAAKDFSSIDSNPQISPEEKDFLKKIDWSNMEIDVTDDEKEVGLHVRVVAEVRDDIQKVLASIPKRRRPSQNAWIVSLIEDEIERCRKKGIIT